VASYPDQRGAAVDHIFAQRRKEEEADHARFAQQRAEQALAMAPKEPQYSPPPQEEAPAEEQAEAEEENPILDAWKRVQNEPGEAAGVAAQQNTDAAMSAVDRFKDGQGDELVTQGSLEGLTW